MPKVPKLPKMPKMVESLRSVIIINAWYFQHAKPENSK